MDQRRVQCVLGASTATRLPKQRRTHVNSAPNGRLLKSEAKVYQSASAKKDTPGQTAVPAKRAMRARIKLQMAQLPARCAHEENILTQLDSSQSSRVRRVQRTRIREQGAGC